MSVLCPACLPSFLLSITIMWLSAFGLRLFVDGPLYVGMCLCCAMCVLHAHCIFRCMCTVYENGGGCYASYLEARRARRCHQKPLKALGLVCLPAPSVLTARGLVSSNCSKCWTEMSHSQTERGLLYVIVVSPFALTYALVRDVTKRSNLWHICRFFWYIAELKRRNARFLIIHRGLWFKFHSELEIL